MGESLRMPLTPARVLVVEDDPNMVTMLTNRLQASGLEPAIAMTGRDALAAAAASAFDVVLLDLRLPDTDGFEVMAELLQRSPNVPVVIMTAHGNGDTGELAIARGAFAFLLKPFSRTDLLSTIARACGTPEASGA